MRLFKKFNDYYKSKSMENDHIFRLYCASTYGSNSFCYHRMDQILAPAALATTTAGFQK